MSPAWIVFLEAIRKTNNERIRVLQGQEKPNIVDQELQTRALIALAAAVAPNPEKPPFFVEFPQNADGKLDDATWQKWLQHDSYTMIGTHRLLDGPVDADVLPDLLQQLVGDDG